MTPLSQGPARRDTPTVLRALALLAIGFALTLITVQLVVSGGVTYPPARVISDGTAILVQALLVMLLARKVWR
jgi:hypothetical protein